MSKIFISYRRGDTRQAAGRLYDGLTALLGEDAVFKDVHSIELGSDWRDRITELVSSSGVVLVLMGANRDLERLRDPDDVLREELLVARRQGRTVLPVLVDDATMPAKHELPADVAWLSDLQAAVLRDADLQYDHDKLVRASCEILGIELRASPSRGTLRPDVGSGRGLFAIHPRHLHAMADRWAHRSGIRDGDAAERPGLADPEVADYLRCTSRVRDGFTSEQLAYYDDLTRRVADEGAPAANAWRRANPFPGPLPPGLADIVVAEFDGGASESSVEIANRASR